MKKKTTVEEKEKGVKRDNREKHDKEKIKYKRGKKGKKTVRKNGYKQDEKEKNTEGN